MADISEMQKIIKCPLCRTDCRININKIFNKFQLTDGDVKIILEEFKLQSTNSSIKNLNFKENFYDIIKKHNINLSDQYFT
jgi:hypothetical protein